LSSSRFRSALSGFALVRMLIINIPSSVATMNGMSAGCATSCN